MIQASGSQLVGREPKVGCDFSGNFESISMLIQQYDSYFNRFTHPGGYFCIYIDFLPFSQRTSMKTTFFAHVSDVVKPFIAGIKHHHNKRKLHKHKFW